MTEDRSEIFNRNEISYWSAFILLLMWTYSYQRRSHLTASDLSNYYRKLIDNGAVLTIKFSIAIRVKGNTFINNCNLYLSEKTFIVRNLDDANMLDERSEFISKCRHINKRLLNIVKKDSTDWLWYAFGFTVYFCVLLLKSFCF